jgi:ribosomal protein S8
MKNKLIVLEPFALLNVGDELVWNKEEGMYVAEYDEKENTVSEDKKYLSNYYSKYSLSEDYAQVLIKEGYLKEATEQSTKNFVNVFDEIDNLRQRYELELDNLNKNRKLMNKYEVMEKETVLTNLVTVLDHLKTLRK